MDFENSHLLKGDAIIREYENAHHEIGGMIEVLRQNDIEIIPVFFAEATPGGIITADTYETLVQEMLSALQQVLPVDGCMVVPHGAAVSEDYPDMDGQWLYRLRKILGSVVPIIGTLDPHANLSHLMAASTDALVAYKTNPHLDQRETGKAAASLMIQTLKHQIKPIQLLTQTQVAISIEQQYTSRPPCIELYTIANELKKNQDIYEVSIILGFPYADVEEMGTSFLIIARSESIARDAGIKLKKELTTNRAKFVGEKKNIVELLPEISSSPKPVLLLDMGDNVGAGAPGDSTQLLTFLEAHPQWQSFFCIYAPETVKHLFTCTVGSRQYIRIGSTETSFYGEVFIEGFYEGKFEEKNPRHGGQVRYDMGPTAVVKTQAGNTVLLHSLRVPPFSLSQLTSAGIDAANFDIITAKGVNAPIAAYAPICKTIFQVNTAGVTQADMTAFNFQHRRKPLYPFETL